MSDRHVLKLKVVFSFIICIILPTSCMIVLTNQKMTLQEHIKQESSKLYNVKCYSGGEVIIDDTAQGKPYNYGYGVYKWISSIDGQDKEWAGPCIATLIK
jgi:hypothetical protein